MSKKKNNFTKLFDYFNGDEEDSEEEIENYQHNYNNMIKAKNSLKNKETHNNKYIEEQNQIITELYSDNEEEEDYNNDVMYNREKRIVQNNDDENDFDNFQFTSFKPKNNNISKTNEENKNTQIVDITKKETNDLNNENNINSNNEEIYTKVITKQCSFGKDNGIFNNNINKKTDEIVENKQIKKKEIKEEYNPEYLIIKLRKYFIHNIY